MTETITGGCHCGSLRYESGAGPIAAAHCQCLNCRKISATGHASFIMLPKAAVTITGAATAYLVEADSGNRVTRHFCPTCGTPVYSTNSGFPDAVFVTASGLDDPEVFQPMMLVYAGRGPAWDLIDPALPRFEGMPPAEAVPG